MYSKALSTSKTMSKQHCRMLQVEQFFRRSRMLLRHCCHFSNNVAVFGNNVERKFVLSTKSKQIEHVQFVSFDIFAQNKRQHCCQKRQRCRSNNDFVERTIFYDKLVRHCCRCGRGLTMSYTRRCTKSQKWCIVFWRFSTR